jgi:hypothetical protein
MILILDSTVGDNATYTFLVLVMLSVVFYNWGKYKITFGTPDILLADNHTITKTDKGTIYGWGF